MVLEKTLESPLDCKEIQPVHSERDQPWDFFRADELVIVTKNLYGGYSAAVKNVLDRSIGTSTPFSTYRGRQMHHTLRYGKHSLWKVIVYGEISEAEKNTFRYLAERNAVNDGYERSEAIFLEDLAELEAAL